MPNFGGYTVPQVEVNGTIVSDYTGYYNLPQSSSEGTLECTFTYSGQVINRYGQPLEATILAFALSDDSLVEEVRADAAGEFEIITTTPCYLISLPDSFEMDGLGWGERFG